MTDLDDLIARLLATPPVGDFAGSPPVAAQRISDMLQDRTEAAAALEALRAENERLRKAAERALKEAVADDFDEWFADLRAAVTPR